jgi:N-acetylneuraminate synthase/N,N'-diacetyllegionaminate synthase
MAAAPVRVASRSIGAGQPVFVICEAGVTNYGDRELAIRQIDAAVRAGADAVKFQCWRTEELVSKPAAARLAGELGYDWFDRLKSKELTHDDLRALQAYAAKKGILFFVTPHDLPSLEFVDRELQVPLLKVGSGEAHNPEFLRAVGATGKPVLISFGLQTDDEVRAAVATLRDAGAAGVVAFHCVTQYPTPPELASLDRLAALRQLLDVPCGYSDHTVGWHIPTAAVALGACAIEKHLTFDKRDPRSLDNPGALLPDEFVLFVSDVRELEQAVTPPSGEARAASREQARSWAGQSIVAVRDLPAGTRIERTMLALKRPGRGGLGPEALEAVVGRRTSRPVPADEQITAADLE